MVAAGTEARIVASQSQTRRAKLSQSARRSTRGIAHQRSPASASTTRPARTTRLPVWCWQRFLMPCLCQSKRLRAPVRATFLVRRSVQFVVVVLPGMCPTVRWMVQKMSTSLYSIHGGGSLLKPFPMTWTGPKGPRLLLSSAVLGAVKETKKLTIPGQVGMSLHQVRRRSRDTLSTRVVTIAHRMNSPRTGGR